MFLLTCRVDCAAVPADMTACEPQDQAAKVQDERDKVMENRFAGAQNQGERRRRRLAKDELDETTSEIDSSILAEFSHQNVLRTGTVAPSETLGMISRVISRRLWKHVVFLTLIAAVLCGIAWRSFSGDPESSRLFLASDSFSESVAGLLLLLAGQLCFLIGWVRQESVIDFRGRYRWWRWLGAAAIVAAVLLVTHTIQLVPNALAMIVEPLTGPVAAARRTLVVVPGLAFGIVVLVRILPDMSRSFLSQSLFVTALLIAIIRQGLVLGSTNDGISAATLNAMFVGAAFFLFAATLLHCRFVAYICNDPPLSTVKPNVVRIADVANSPSLDNVGSSKVGDTSPNVNSDLEAPKTAAAKSGKAKSARKTPRKSRSAKRKAA